MYTFVSNLDNLITTNGSSQKQDSNAVLKEA